MIMLDRLTARAQVGITLVFTLGYFALLFTLILGYSRMQQGIVELVSTLVSVLTAVVVQINSYWFARHRNHRESAHVEHQGNAGDSGRSTAGPEHDLSHRLFERKGGGAGSVGGQTSQGSDTAHPELRGRSDSVQRASSDGREHQPESHKAATGSAGGAGPTRSEQDPAGSR